MTKKPRSTKARVLPMPEIALDPVALLYALPTAVLTIDHQYRIHSLNPAAEDFLGGSIAALKGKELAQYLYPVSRLLRVLDNVFEKQTVVREHDVEVYGQHSGHQRVNLQAAPIAEQPQIAILTIEKQSPNMQPVQSFSPAAASMASILAHELKNPLSGIKGAAQLLQKKLSAKRCAPHRADRHRSGPHQLPHQRDGNLLRRQ